MPYFQHESPLLSGTKKYIGTYTWRPQRKPEGWGRNKVHIIIIRIRFWFLVAHEKYSFTTSFSNYFTKKQHWKENTYIHNNFLLALGCSWTRSHRNPKRTKPVVLWWILTFFQREATVSINKRDLFSLAWFWGFPVDTGILSLLYSTVTAAHQFTGNITEVLSCYSLKYSTSRLDGLMHSTITHYVAKYVVTWKLLEVEIYKCPFSQLQRTGYYFTLHLFLSKKSSYSCCNTPPSDYLEVLFICFLHICIPITFFSLWSTFPCPSALLFHHYFSLQ